MPHPFKGTTKLRTSGPKPPKIGEIPGFPVGSRWPGRRELADDGLHAYLVKGIWGTQQDGAYSIILSGGYEDDVDKGDEFTYTGQGGQTKREEGEIWDNKQIKDQEWIGGNLVLLNSLREDPHESHPIRVIRGHLLKSRWAPIEGYQYDGLYKVVKAEFKTGNSGFSICSFKFERLPGQIDLPGKNPIRPMQPKRSDQLNVRAPSSASKVHRIESDVQEHDVHPEHNLPNPRKTRRSLSLEILDQEAESLTIRRHAKKQRRDMKQDSHSPSPHFSPMTFEILSRSASCSTEETPPKGSDPISGTTLTNVITGSFDAENDDDGVLWATDVGNRSTKN